ncbi:uncharacterized protein LOC120085080 isoform X2 [Benincasa hispida]|uniref:uncharacterized protein LOC120085080 isoform X2 n=1 Tax=Benincasa hispida TaxID=102211 RepID=UPI0018FF4AA0|nr:uncharacterized protein LOC120085080 isoform X2 [Benincasa hispida]
MFMAFHQKWLQNPISLFKKLFHLLTLTLLTLSLPLSFLLFCRLVRSHYLHALLPLSTPLPSILSVDRVLLLSLISLISVAMALGIDQGMEIVIDVSSLGLRRSLWCRLMFFLGLHTTMIHWSKVAVKSVVDDTVFGAPMEESWSERIAMAVSFGGLWLWRLRDEAESPAIVAENMMELLMDPTMVDFCSLALYYLIVAIGFVKTLRSFVWFLKFLLRERKEESSSQFSQAKRIEVV